jgi:hypothetical protein
MFGRREKMKKALLLALMAGISIALIRIDLSSGWPCPEPDPENMCFNDAECERQFTEEYTNYFRQFYPEPCTIEVIVMSVCPWGVCENWGCKNYYDITIFIHDPIAGEDYEFYNYNQPSETWPCY